MEKYERVLELMKSKGGKITVDDPDLAALLGRLIYRLSVYISYIRRLPPYLEVVNIRTGRKVTSYELIDVTSPIDSPGDRVYRNSKYIKAPETTAATI